MSEIQNKINRVSDRKLQTKTDAELEMRINEGWCQLKVLIDTGNKTAARKLLNEIIGLVDCRSSEQIALLERERGLI